MLLSDLIGAEVRDAHGTRVGRLIDVRFRLSGSASPPRARVHGIIVSPRSAVSYLGYERTAASRPAALDRILRWMHRGSFLVAWDEVARLEPDRVVVLRDGYTRAPSTLDAETAR